jgi:hypothetical protein
MQLLTDIAINISGLIVVACIVAFVIIAVIFHFDKLFEEIIRDVFDSFSKPDRK